MSRLVEFFEGESNELSMTRLLCFLSFWPATYVTVKINTVEALAVYVGCYAVAYLGGKASNIFMPTGKRK